MENLSSIPDKKEKDYATMVLALEFKLFEASLSQPTKNQTTSYSESLQEFGANIGKLFHNLEDSEQFVHQIYVSSFIDGLKDIEL